MGAAQSWQEWLVGLMVAVAALYALWHGLPQAWRRPLGRVHPRLGQAPGCSACDDCGRCAATTSLKGQTMPRRGGAAGEAGHGQAAGESSVSVRLPSTTSTSTRQR